MPKQDTIRTLVRFGCVGGLVAVVHSILIWYFFHVAGLGARPSFWAGYFPAVALHFCLTKWWTFRCARRDLARQVLRYLFVAALAAVVQFGVYHGALTWVTRDPNVAYVIAAILQMGLGFVLMRQKVFQVPASTASGNGAVGRGNV
jgi:putative flippase GtrA